MDGTCVTSTAKSGSVLFNAKFGGCCYLVISVRQGIPPLTSKFSTVILWKDLFISNLSVILEEVFIVPHSVADGPYQNYCPFSSLYARTRQSLQHDTTQQNLI